MAAGMRKYYKKIYKKSRKEFTDFLSRKIESGQGCFVITANPEILMMGKKVPEMDEALSDRNTVIIPDGIGVIKGGGMLGVSFAERIPGVEVCEFLMDYADRNRKSVYLFGAQRHVLETFVKKLKKEHPGIRLCGWEDGYVEDKESVFRNIIAQEPDIVLVALGVPQQEILIHKFFSPERRGIYIGVGGSFDVMSGLKQRAPAFFIRHNLEWLYRITREPKRLRRFWNSNVKFLFELRKEKNECKRTG